MRKTGSLPCQYFKFRNKRFQSKQIAYKLNKNVYKIRYAIFPPSSIENYFKRMMEVFN